MRKKTVLLAAFLSISILLNAAVPYYQSDRLPGDSGKVSLGNPVSVSFVIPEKNRPNLFFSSSNSGIIPPDDPLVLELYTDSTGRFSVIHDELYAYWDVSGTDPFEIHLYLDSPLNGETQGESLHWTITAGNGSSGGAEGKYGNDSHDNHIILTNGDISTKWESITIDVPNLHEMLTDPESDRVAYDVYSGAIVLEYVDKGGN